jgi:hypothetical protein
MTLGPPSSPRSSSRGKAIILLAVAAVFLAVLTGASVWLVRTYVLQADTRTVVLPDVPLQGPMATPAARAAAATTDTALAAPGAAAPAPARNALIGGIVRNEQGQPIAGVRVRFLWRDATGRGGNSAASTNAQGKWSTRRVPSDSIASLQFILSHNDYSSSSQYQSLATPEELQKRTAVFVMKQGVPIGGFVRNEQGEPIAEASIRIIWRDPSVPGPSNSVALTSDARGKWTTHAIPANAVGSLQFSLTHPEYAGTTNSYRSLPVSADALLKQTAVLTMQRGVDVNGVVVNGDGQPVAGADVSTRFFWGNPRTATTDVTTDFEGKFVFHHQETSSDLTLTASAQGYGPTVAHVQPGTDSTPARLVLTPGRTIRGTVVDESGRPVSGAQVMIQRWQNSQSIDVNTTTRADGTFQLHDAPKDLVSITAYKEGYNNAQADCDSGQDNLDLTLRRPVTVHGTVTDARTHQPIAAFTVFTGVKWSTNPAPVFAQGIGGRTFAGGQFNEMLSGYGGEIDAWYVKVQARGYLPAVSSPLNKSGEADFALEPAKDLQGTVFTADGTPAADATVALAIPQQNIFISDGQINSQGEPPAMTDARGHYDLPPQSGKFKLVALSAAGFAQVGSDAIAKSPDVHLTPWARAEGRLLLNGKPGANQNISVFVNQQQQWRPDEPMVQISNQCQTDADGHFSFDRVAPGDIQVSHEVMMSNGQYNQGFNVQTQEATAVSGQTITVNLGGAGRPVTGRVILPAALAGRADLNINANLHNVANTEPQPPPIPDSVKKNSPDAQRTWWRQFMQSDDGKAYVKRLRDFQMNNQQVPVAPGGAFTIDNVAPGTYQLTVSVNPYRGGMPLASAKAKFTVDPIPGGSSDQPMQIPDIQVVTSP